MTSDEAIAILSTAKTEEEYYALAEKIGVSGALFRASDVFVVHDPKATETREERRARWLAEVRAHRTPQQMNGA